MSGAAFRIGASAASVVVLPVLVAIVLQAPEPTSVPDPTKAALTVQHTGDSSFHVAVSALGAAPTEPAVLADKEGLNIAEVVAADADDCASEARVPSPPIATADTEWCLRVSGIEVGSEVTGNLTGADTTLALTVTRRHGYFGKPLIATVLGLLVALLLLLLPKASREWINRFLLDRLLEKNRNLTPGRISGLDEWVTRRRRDGHGDRELITILSPLLTDNRASDDATKYRETLEESLQTLVASPEGCVLLDKARRELRTDNRRSDFIDEDGARVPHPAATATANVEWYKVQRVNITALQRRIGDLDEDNQAVLLEGCRQLEAKLCELDPTSGKADFVKQRDQLAADVRNAAPSIFKSDDSVENAAPFGSDPGEASTPTTEPIRGARLRALAAVGVVSTILIVLMTLTLMFITVAMTAWQPKPTFGTWPDYWAVFSAALTSSAAAAVFSALSLWSLKPDAE